MQSQSKAQIIAELEKELSEINPDKQSNEDQWRNGRIHGIKRALYLANQLDEPTPETLPFTWPIPDGYEVVTRDGRKVTQLVKFEEVEDVEHYLMGVVDKTVKSFCEDGRYLADGTHKNDLSLRPIAPEMVTVWVNYYERGCRFFTVCGMQVFEVTHWMPLPEPPTN